MNSRPRLKLKVERKVLKPEREQKCLHEQLSKADKAALKGWDKDAQLLRDAIRTVVEGDCTGLYVFGPPGMGKSDLVGRTLEELGVSKRPPGHMTPIGFVEWLEAHQDGVLYLDDVLGLFEEKQGRQYLLNALARQKRGDRTRWFAYKKHKLDKKFPFRGGVIALSNLALHEHTSAIKRAIVSRVQYVCWDPSDEKLAARMRDAVKAGWTHRRVTIRPTQAREVADFVIEECANAAVRLDLRLLFDHALPHYARWDAGKNERHWKAHVRAAINSGRTDSPPADKQDELARHRQIVKRIDADARHKTKGERVKAFTKATGIIRSTQAATKAYNRRMRDVRRGL